MAILSGFLLVVFIITALLLIIIVLMQDEQGEGLGGIFGGGGAAPVGNRSGNILTRATSIIATIFLVTLFGYAWINRTPEDADVEAAARALEAEEEGVVEWWRVDEPVTIPDESVPDSGVELEAQDDDAADETNDDIDVE